MAYEYLNNRAYRMPTHFGPAPGPRQNLESYTPNHSDFPKTVVAGVAVSAKREQLEAILPPGFSVWGEPHLIFEMKYMTEIEWLAGRGYNLLGIRCPAIYRGSKQTAKGYFQIVYWENLTDPILTGRDELGANKIYADIPPPRTFQGSSHYHCSWMDHTFFEMEISSLAPASGAAVQLTPSGETPDGLMFHKYIPKANVPGEADVEYATLVPAAGSSATVESRLTGTGSVRLIRSSFEQLPTMHHVVNALEQIELGPVLSAEVSTIRGGRDFADTTIIE